MVAIGVLAVLLVLDIVALPSQLPRARATGNDYVSILASQRRNQTVNFIIGAALHETSGTVTRVIVPYDLDDLSVRPGDTMLGGVQPALQRSLLERLVGGDLRQQQYDPRVNGATISAWAASGRLTPYPRQVYLLRPVRKATGAWVLLTDTERLHIFIVSLADVPAGLRVR
jgi:hypothetical protein